MENSDGIPDLVRIIMTWEGLAHLYEDKRVCLDGFEELTEYKVNECYKILVRLFPGKGFLVGEDSLEQVQGGYLTRPLRNVCGCEPPTQETHGRCCRRTWKNRPSALARTACRCSRLTTRFISSDDVNSL